MGDGAVGFVARGEGRRLPRSLLLVGVSWVWRSSCCFVVIVPVPWSFPILAPVRH